MGEFVGFLIWFFSLMGLVWVICSSWNSRYKIFCRFCLCYFGFLIEWLILFSDCLMIDILFDSRKVLIVVLLIIIIL